MTRTKKEEIVKELSQSFANQGAIIVCDYKGMSVQALEGVRKLAKENNVHVQVVKNTLAKLALKNANCEELELTQNNIFLCGEDQIATCKVADKSAQANKEHFKIKTGLIESKAVDVATIEAMAKLPGREELIGMLLNVWLAPVRNWTIGLQALADKKQEEEQN